MRLSFPHPLLVRSGHAENTGDIFLLIEPGMYCIVVIVQFTHGRRLAVKYISMASLFVPHLRPMGLNVLGYQSHLLLVNPPVPQWTSCVFEHLDYR